MMELALVGAAKWPSQHHMRAIAASSDWDLAATVGVTDTSGDNAPYPDLQSVLAERRDIRVVSICLPPVLCLEAAQIAIRAGRHVMLGRPGGGTLSQYHALDDLARHHRVALYATWPARETASVEAAKSWLAGKTVRKIDVTWKSDAAEDDAVRQAGGLGVFANGLDALSIVTNISPPSMHVTSAAFDIPDNWQTPIAATLSFHHPQCAMVSARFDARQSGPSEQTIKVSTDQGSLTLTNGGDALLIDDEPFTATSTCDDKGPYSRLYTRFSQLVGNGDIDMDLTPLRHVADAFTIGRRLTTAPVLD